MDETGLRVEMTALFANRCHVFHVPLPEQPRKMVDFRLERTYRVPWHRGCNFSWHEEFGGLQGELGT
jgi:hypothetical protein